MFKMKVEITTIEIFVCEKSLSLKELGMFIFARFEFTKLFCVLFLGHVEFLSLQHPSERLIE